MRGKAADLVTVYFDIGITPAYAGKSAFIPFLAFGTGDHPRLCGEKA